MNNLRRQCTILQPQSDRKGD